MAAVTRPVLFSILGAILLSEVVILFANPPPLKEQMQGKFNSGNMASSFDRPLIVLHQGTSPSHDYVYNTAYWTGWGTGM